MAGLTGKVLVNTLCHRLFDFDMAILARCFSFDMPHAAYGLVTIHAFDLLGNVYVLGQPRRLGEIFPEIAVAPSSLHGACVAYEGASAAARTVRRGRGAAEGVRSLFPRGRVVAVETTCMADVARLLLRYRLLARQRQIDLLYDLLRIFEGEPVAFRPADRLGVRKGRPSIIRTVDIVPRSHGALPEVSAHDARCELLHLFRMAG